MSSHKQRPEAPAAPLSGRVLALDPGKVRVGVAMSDELGILASPLAVLDGRDRARLVASVRELVREHEVVRIVIGLPVHMSGEASAGSARAIELAQKLADATRLEVEMVDERLSSVEATRKLRAGAKRPRRGHPHVAASPIDDKAACVILQAWLDARRSAASD